jgi:alpha-glucosidase
LIRHNAFPKRLIFLQFCALFLAGWLPLLAQPISAAHISPLPDGVELTDGPCSLDVQILENQMVSVHVRPDGKSTPRTLVIDPQPRLQPLSAVTRSEQNGIYTLSTSGMSVQIEETKPYRIAFLNSAGQQLLSSENPLCEARNASVTMKHAADDTLYGIHGLGLKDTAVGLTRNDGGRVAAGVQGDSGAPLIFSARYGVLVDSDGGEFTTAPGSFTFQHSSRPDIEYFVFVGPPLQTMAAVSRIVGPPPMPPKWTLGFLNSQWGSTQAEVEEIVARYRKEALPLDGFILDFDWKAWGEDRYGEWRWNSTSGAGNVAPDKFPDGASGKFARTLAAEGVKLGGILKPRILTTVAGDPNQPTEAAAYATAHNFWYPEEDPSPDYFSHRIARDLDFSIPEERKWFWEHLLPAFHSGMAGWWNDEADYIGSTIFNNFQFLNMGRMIYEGQRADSNQRVWSINRTFYLGSTRYGYAGWSGDIDSGFVSMAFQRERMLAALDTGEFHWSMDTGGFHGHPSAENYARWIEFAAFVPIMRVHGELDEKRQPWMYGPVAEAAARNALDLRYELLPYIYSYERLNTEGEVGLVRPLFWEFPSDPGSATQDAEWMFGDALLVSPVVDEGATCHQVYLPPGQWFDYASGKPYAGAQTIQLATDAKTWKDIPLFVRSGSIVATQSVEQYTGQRSISEITLDIFPAETNADFTVYDDDGETYNYEKGDYLRQEIASQQKGNAISVTIGGATGSYASPLRTYLLRIHTGANKVTLDGVALPAATATPASVEPDTNWVRQNDRFGPVVLIRITAGAKKPSAITLQ